MAKKKLSVAFIGAGGIAGAHMRQYAEMDDVEMVAMADIHPGGMEKWADQYGIEGSYLDYKEMLRKVKPMRSASARQTVCTRKRRLPRSRRDPTFWWKSRLR